MATAGMTHAALRTHFNTSGLVRLLADRIPADTAGTALPFAQQLGQWVSFKDAMTLYSALNPGALHTSASHQELTEAFASVEADLCRARTAMVEVIQRACSPAPGSARIKFPTPAIETGPEIAVSWAPFHRFCLSVQREMDSKLAPVRTAVQLVLAQASPALRQLGALDAVFDHALLEHERRLLGTVPKLLEKRFTQLRQAHQERVVASGQMDDSAAWLSTGGWLAGFRDELGRVMLAQWELRVEPVAALVHALGNEVNGQT